MANPVLPETGFAFFFFAGAAAKASTKHNMKRALKLAVESATAG
jgi:hypothetical protein